eukprot:2619540-Amphidinium_carterae.1
MDRWAAARLQEAIWNLSQDGPKPVSTQTQLRSPTGNYTPQPPTPKLRLPAESHLENFAQLLR